MFVFFLLFFLDVALIHFICLIHLFAHGFLIHLYSCAIFARDSFIYTSHFYT